MSHVRTEVASQPACWARAATMAGDCPSLPSGGERVAVVGCGTSWFVAQSYAALREHRGHGETDAYAASEFPDGRRYDRVLAISRSGTTTEVLELLGRLNDAETVAVTANPEAPITTAVSAVVALSFADERSVVQTRFATTALALLRAHLGDDMNRVVEDGRHCGEAALPADLLEAKQVTFLGRGWTVGLAHEAALKMREAAGAWSESYPAMEYRHGPISIAEPGRVIWMFGALPPGLAEEVTATGATMVASGDCDPLAHLILAQRLAVEQAAMRGLDPDRPRHLTRSVVLDTTGSTSA